MRRIRNFIQREGVQVRRPENSLDDVVFFLLCFFIVLNLVYSKQRESNGFITEKTMFF